MLKTLPVIVALLSLSALLAMADPCPCPQHHLVAKRKPAPTAVKEISAITPAPPAPTPPATIIASNPVQQQFSPPAEKHCEILPWVITAGVVGLIAGLAINSGGRHHHAHPPAVTVSCPHAPCPDKDCPKHGHKH